MDKTYPLGRWVLATWFYQQYGPSTCKNTNIDAFSLYLTHINCWNICHLLATAWRSFISDLSNHTWGQDRTIDLWMTPISPPWTWPTWKYSGVKAWHPVQPHNANTSDIVNMTHHSITSIVCQNDYVNGGGVVGNTDTSFLGPILSVMHSIKQETLVIWLYKGVLKRKRIVCACVASLTCGKWPKSHGNACFCKLENWENRIEIVIRFLQWTVHVHVCAHRSNMGEEKPWAADRN